MNRASLASARIAALRTPPAVPLPGGGDMLPRARLRVGQFARVGAMLLLGISPSRFARERRRGLLEVFSLGAGIYCLEVPHWHEGPATDYLVEHSD